MAHGVVDAALYVPAAHGKQVVALSKASVSVTEPAAQLVHAVADAALYVPATQLAHGVVDAALYVPAAHGKQVVALSKASVSVTEPAVQLEQIAPAAA